MGRASPSVSGLAFRAGDFQKGTELWGRGMAEMERAVSLQPDNVAVRIPRAASLIEASRQMPPAQGAPILKIAVDDYERVLALQASYFDKLSDHARGEAALRARRRLGATRRQGESARLFHALDLERELVGSRDVCEGVARRRTAGERRPLRRVVTRECFSLLASVALGRLAAAPRSAEPTRLRSSRAYGGRKAAAHRGRGQAAEAHERRSRQP